MHLLVSGTGTLLLILVAPFVAKLLHEPALATYLILFALDIPLFSLAQAHREVLIGLGSFRERARMSTGRWIARLCFVILFVQLGLSIPGAILGMIGASIVELIIARIYIQPSPFFRPSLKASILWTHVAPLLISAVSMRLYDKADILLLKYLGGTTAQAGFYAAAQNLALLPGLFSLSFSPLMLATLTRLLAASHKEEARRIIQQSLRLMVLLLPFIIVISVTSTGIVTLIFGAPFSPAGPILSILIVSAIGMTIVSTHSAILVASDRPHWTYFVSAPMLLLAIAGYLVVIPRWGPIGAALVSTFFSLAAAFASGLMVHSIWRMFPPVSTVLRSLAVAVLAAAVGILWQTHGVMIVVEVLVLGLIVVGGLILLGEFTNNEIDIAREFFLMKSEA
jgi:O-antigen/teichoic acid export membrane protein